MQPLLLSGIHTWKKVAFQRNTLWNNLRALCKQCTRPENVNFQSAFPTLFIQNNGDRIYILKSTLFCQFGDCTPFPCNATQVDLYSQCSVDGRTNPSTALSLRSLRLHASWSLSMGERRRQRKRRRNSCIYGEGTLQ